ncbi:hypothetical protein pb186bvf_002784 [Paramecium bursaria]
MSFFNPFRYVADFLHLFSFVILILKIRNTRNCIGNYQQYQRIVLQDLGNILSCFFDTILGFIAILYFFVQYNDEAFIYCFNPIHHLLDEIQETLLLGMFLFKIFKSYDGQSDDFPHFKFLYPGAALLAIFFNTGFSTFELSWSYSIWLESLAIIPQLHMLQKMKDVENITGNYVGALGVYRFFYILSWIYKYTYTSDICWTSALGGILQSVLYADFLYYYVVALRSGKNLTLNV